jgi:hypothetical protein
LGHAEAFGPLRGDAVGWRKIRLRDLETATGQTFSAERLRAAILPKETRDALIELEVRRRLLAALRDLERRGDNLANVILQMKD